MKPKANPRTHTHSHTEFPSGGAETCDSSGVGHLVVSRVLQTCDSAGVGGFGVRLGLETCDSAGVGPLVVSRILQTCDSAGVGPLVASRVLQTCDSSGVVPLVVSGILQTCDSAGVVPLVVSRVLQTCDSAGVGTLQPKAIPRSHTHSHTPPKATSRSHTHSHTPKTWSNCLMPLCLALFICLSSLAFSQSPYLGGQADGYASAKGRIVAIAPDWARVYPSPVQRGGRIQIYASGDLSGLVVSLYDVQGRLLIHGDWAEMSDSPFLELPTATLAAGCYLLRLHSDEKLFSQKIIVWRE